MNKNKIISGLSFIALGFLALFNYIGFISITSEEIIGIIFIVYSIPAVYLSLSNGDRTRLVFADILFLVGVLLLVKSFYEILNTRGIVFASILFINGSVFLILFIENVKEKIFLAAAVLSFLLSYLSITAFSKLGLFDAANKIADTLEIFWPVILILMGISIFINRKN